MCKLLLKKLLAMFSSKLFFLIQEILIDSNSINVFQEMNIDTEQKGISNILHLNIFSTVTFP